MNSLLPSNVRQQLKAAGEKGHPQEFNFWDFPGKVSHMCRRELLRAHVRARAHPPHRDAVPSSPLSSLFLPRFSPAAAARGLCCALGLSPAGFPAAGFLRGLGVRFSLLTLGFSREESRLWPPLRVFLLLCVWGRGFLNIILGLFGSVFPQTTGYGPTAPR